MDFDGFMERLEVEYHKAAKEKDQAPDPISYAAARARMTALDDAMLWALEFKKNPAALPELENPVP